MQSEVINKTVISRGVHIYFATGVHFKVTVIETRKGLWIFFSYKNAFRLEYGKLENCHMTFILSV
jgi:hypothetical protein